MISILIPIKNWDTTSLINSLVKQGNSVNVSYEIIAIDDFSNSKHDEYNFSMNQYDFVEVFRNEKELGKAKTRNLLAEKANYDWMIFVDDDSFVEDDFIKNYILEIRKGNSDVICGGKIYSSTPPSNKEYSLQWNFGVKRDTKTVDQRNVAKYKYFTSNNFALNTIAFATTMFNESDYSVGFENILFGKTLSENNKRITHINNPTKHIGLKTNQELITKSESNIHNLVKLYKKGTLDKTDIELLTQHYKRKTIISLFGKYSKDFARNRAINKGCLFGFDLYRLILLTEELID